MAVIARLALVGEELGGAPLQPLPLRVNSLVFDFLSLLSVMIGDR